MALNILKRCTLRTFNVVIFIAIILANYRHIACNTTTDNSEKVMSTSSASTANENVNAARVIDKESLKILESQLLSNLGIKNRPKGRADKKYIPQEMYDLFKKRQFKLMNSTQQNTSSSFQGEMTDFANTVRCYNHEESPIDDRFPNHTHKFRLFFNLTEFPETDVLSNALLKVHLLPASSPATRESPMRRVNVYDIVRPGIKDKSEAILTLKDTRIVDIEKGIPNVKTGTNDMFVELHVLDIVERWLADPQNNYGLLVVVKSADDNSSTLEYTDWAARGGLRLRRPFGNDSINDTTWTQQQPLLFTFSTDQKAQAEAASIRRNSGMTAQRPKRTVPDGKSNGSKVQGECRRLPLYVDFAKVGWKDWIVAPDGYNAYYCAGNCPTHMTDHLNASNHAIVKSLVHGIHPHSLPNSCCVPTELAPISLLYVTGPGNNVTGTKVTAVLKNYNDMVVVGCGCR